MPQDDTRERFDINRRRLVQSLGVGGVAGLAGCAGGGDGTDTPGESTPTPEDETPTPADPDAVQMGGELIATFGADVKNFDPTAANDTTSSKAFGLVYEPLVAVDFSGAPQPVLAESVEQLEGDLMWQITLREGITFHDGSELTAADVKATFERYEGTSREADVYNWYSSSTIQDDYTLDVELSAQYAPLKFAMAGVPITPEAVANGDLDLTEDPIGTGPYVFEEHQPDELFRISRNDDYWFTGSDSMPEQPPIETVTFRVITEQSAQLAALQAGDVDLINNVPAESYSDLQDNEDFTVTERTQGGFDFLAFPTNVSPWDNAKVRRGVSRLVPREAIVESVYNGIGSPAYSPISPLAAQFTSTEFNQRMGEEYLGYDTEQAATLLEEGLNEAGVETPFQTTMITNQNPQRVRWCQLIQESLNSTDFFEVSLEQYEWNTFTGIVLAEDSADQNHLMALGWSAGWDADAYVHNLFHTDQFTPACCNLAHYESEEANSLIEQGLQTYDLDERATIYQDLMELVCEEAPMTYIRYGKSMDAFRSDVVKGWQTYPIDSGEFNGVYSPTGAFTYVDK
ncbi:ABC transporter substrate-binding protein [Halorarum halobium]|uniref:ABC transporter substrate-binding protein n=1 Tax=Halorarum halobium TaxID=3075121 RepID=UPI0028AC700E|nr:ABC transporter substrate-binding protein [Halobaculum sp. XH14]